MAHVVELLVGARARAGARRARREPRAPGRHPAALRRPVELRAATGWEPEIPLEQTLADALDAARELEPVS